MEAVMQEQAEAEQPVDTGPSSAEWLHMAREAHTASVSFFDSSIRKDIINDLRQFQGLHPEGSKYYSDGYKAKSRLFRPKTRTAIRKNEATAAEAFFATVDVVSIEAGNDGDPAQQASAAIMEPLLQYRLTKSIPWFQTVIGAYQDAQSVGVCISRQEWYYDAKKGVDKPCIKLLPLENVRIDAAADWTDPINSSPYVIEEMPMYVKDVKARMRAGPTGESKWYQMTDAQILQATNRSLDAIRQTRENKRQDSKAQTQGVTDYMIVWVHRNIIEHDGLDMIFYTLGKEALLSDPVPLEHEYFHGVRPYVMGCCILETHKIYPGGDARITRDLQAEVNEIANLRIDNVKLAMNKRWIARRNKQVDVRSLMRSVPNSVTLATDIDDVKMIDVGDVTASSYNEQDRLNLDFDDVVGTFSQSSVQSNRNLNETVGGMNIINGNASQVGAYQLRTFIETWVEPVLRQLVMLEQAYETDTTLLALCGQKGQLMQKYGIDPLTDEILNQELTISVNVGMAATNPQTKLQNLQMATNAIRQTLADGILERYGMDVKAYIKEIFGQIGYRDGGRFFADMDQQDPRVTALQSQVQQLQTALDAKMPPELLDATVKKILAETERTTAQQVQVGVQAAFGAMQAGQIIAQMPGVAPIADVVMQGAGYQAPNPSGVDPNFPQPAAPVPDANAVRVPHNTSPNFPAQPVSADAGENAGIEGGQ